MFGKGAARQKRNGDPWPGGQTERAGYRASLRLIESGSCRRSRMAPTITRFTSIVKKTPKWNGRSTNRRYRRSEPSRDTFAAAPTLRRGLDRIVLLLQCHAPPAEYRPPANRPPPLAATRRASGPAIRKSAFDLFPSGRLLGIIPIRRKPFVQQTQMVFAHRKIFRTKAAQLARKSLKQLLLFRQRQPIDGGLDLGKRTHAATVAQSLGSGQVG